MGRTFRLMTANLLLDRRDHGDFGEVLDRYQPDVVVIQELAPAMAPVLAGRYPYHHLNPARDYRGQGVASRLPARLGTLPLPCRPGAWARVEWEEGPVYVAGVHLLNPVNFPWIPAAVGRRRQVAALERWGEETAGDHPVVVAGDINATPAWPAYRRLVGTWEDLVGAWAESEGTEPEPTWSWRPGWRRLLRIDHILGRGIAARAVEVVAIGGSDHAAVIADLEPTEAAGRDGMAANPA